jgi:hypothetical protein
VTLKFISDHELRTTGTFIATNSIMRTPTLAYGAAALLTTFFLSSAQADPGAYMSDRSGDFGSVDLSTGDFTLIGNMGVTMTGMALDGGTLYGGQYLTGNLYTINPTTGGVSLVGSSSESYELFGSTPAGLFALGADMNLYSINATTGAAKLVGATGLSLSGSWFGMSTASSTLYFSDGPELYSLSTSTGLGTLVGNMGGAQMGAMITEGGTLYGGNDNGAAAVDTINPLTGVATTGPDLTGLGGNFWAFAPETSGGNSVPDAASSIGLLGAVCAGGLLFRRSATKSVRFSATR